MKPVAKVIFAGVLLGLFTSCGVTNDNAQFGANSSGESVLLSSSTFPSTSTNRPVCLAKDSLYEGWYWPNGKVIKYENCSSRAIPVCRAIGTSRSNGWYSDDQFIAVDQGCERAGTAPNQPINPTGHYPVCRGMGTRSEGWYWADTGRLIEYARCSASPAPIR